MKRFLLISVVCAITFSIFAQPKFATITGPGKDLIVKQLQMHPDQVYPYSGENVIGQKSFNNTIIGSTWYDSQTVNYGNVMQRIWAYPDGTVGATWMCAGQDLVPERGTGYNYFDGNDWGTPNLHVGPADRMGWPSYAPWGPDGEIIAQYRYIANEGPIKFYKRENKGQGDWIETALASDAGVSLVWHSMITSGENHEYIHVLAYTYDAEYQGQPNALLYYRSSDGAESWEIDGIVIDGLGPDYILTASALKYAWANPVGNTIAFTYGFDEFGGRVFKSYDNGDSWEVIQVMETPFTPFDPPADSIDIPCGIGTSACALDSQGNVHVVFPRMIKVYIAGAGNYYPYTDGLIYWNESMPVIDTTLISSYTLDYLDAAGNLCGWVMPTTYTIPESQPDYANPLCGFPQLSIDADDNIFVASSTVAPDFSNGEFFYRHIIVNSSFDLGNSWEGQIDLNEDIQYIFSECAFPELAPVIGDDFHVVFQEDPFPGMYEWLEDHPAVNNNIMHITIEKDVFVGVKEPAESMPFELSVYPNPVAAVAFLNLKLQKAGNISVNLINQVGQSVYSNEPGRYDEGRHVIRMDVSELPAGIYSCVVKLNGQQLAKKVVIL